MEYCVYLTTYKGNKLPMFYIGYSKISNIENGYRGSVSSLKYKDVWRKELKENPHLFVTKIIVKFETKEKAIEKEHKIQKILKVHRNPLYTNMAVLNEKFYCTNFEHLKKPKTKEQKEILRIKNKEQFSDPIKRKRHIEGLKKSNGYHKNKIWINNGSTNKRVTEEDFKKMGSDWKKGRIFPKGKKFWDYNKKGSNNPFYGKKHTEKTKKKISKTKRNNNAN